jgi:uncharacterized membrane protein
MKVFADDKAALEPKDRGQVVFDARLTPHRSLSPRGFIVLMSLICAINFAAGLIFFLAGAWPVIAFLGIDVLLIYLAFRINYRRAKMYETLRLTRSDLTVHRVDPRGEVKSWSFQPAWLQVLIDDPPGHDSQLTLRSHGRSLVIGRFLTADERQDLAKALRRALVESRAAPGV